MTAIMMTAHALCEPRGIRSALQPPGLSLRSQPRCLADVSRCAVPLFSLPVHVAVMLEQPPDAAAEPLSQSLSLRQTVSHGGTVPPSVAAECCAEPSLPAAVSPSVALSSSLRHRPLRAAE